MVASASRSSLNLPLLPLGAAIGSALVLLAIAIAPADLLESAVAASGLPALVPAAAPPLGLTARAALVFLAACGLAGGAWLLTRLGVDWGLGSAWDADGTIRLPELRRADAHPDAPARAPVHAARDLGDPPFAALDEEGCVIPADLDTPMAAVDPASVRPDPLPAPEPVRPLVHPRPAAPLVTDERIETFELTPPARTPFLPIAPERTLGAIAAPETDATIHALLTRLERGIDRRRNRPAPPHIHAALASLRHAAGA